MHGRINLCFRLRGGCFWRQDLKPCLYLYGIGTAHLELWSGFILSANAGCVVSFVYFCFVGENRQNRLMRWGFKCVKTMFCHQQGSDMRHLA